MNADPRRSAIAVAIMSALCALPAVAADYSSGSSQSTMSDSAKKSSSALSNERSGTSAGSSSGRNTRQSDAKSSANVGEAMDMMVRADTNKDGVVTKDEVQKLDSRLAAHFEQADTNHDGKLSLKEFEKLLSYREDASHVGGTSGRTPSGTTGSSGMSRSSSGSGMQR